MTRTARPSTPRGGAPRRGTLRRRGPVVVAAGLVGVLGLGGVALAAGWSAPARSRLVGAQAGPAAEPAAVPVAAAPALVQLPAGTALTAASASGGSVASSPGRAAPAGAAAPSASSASSGQAPVAARTGGSAAAVVVSAGMTETRLAGRPAPAWAIRPAAATTVVALRTGRVTAYPTPSQKHGITIRLVNPTPQGFPLTMAALGTDRSRQFLRVLLPVRPNQTYAWIKASDVRQYTNPYRMEISQRQHTMLLWKDRTVVGSFPVATGTGGTPTPNGNFFVNAVLPQAFAGGDYGPVILSTSGFSEVYNTFGGGEAAIGIHGTANRASVGTSASHGCVRMHNEAIALLARTVTVGTLVSIHA